MDPFKLSDPFRDSQEVGILMKFKKNTMEKKKNSTYFPCERPLWIATVEEMGVLREFQKPCCFPGRVLLNVEEEEEAGLEEEIGSGHAEEEVVKGGNKGVEGSREMIIDQPYKNGTKVQCLQPAIKQFPRTPWNKEARQHGWVISYRW